MDPAQTQTGISAFFAQHWPTCLVAILSALVMHLWDRFRSRIATISWTASFQRLTPANDAPNLRSIQVLHGQLPCKNLYSCRVVVKNESEKDLPAFDLLFTFNQEFGVVFAAGGLDSSAKQLLLSNSYFGTLQQVLALEAEKQSGHLSYAYLIHNREFAVASMNRGCTATFDFTVHSDSPAAIASVRVTSEAHGIRVLSRPPIPELLGVPQKWAIIIGLLIGCAVTALVALSSIPPLAIAFATFAVGTFAALFGVAAIWIMRKTRALLS